MFSRRLMTFTDSELSHDDGSVLELGQLDSFSVEDLKASLRDAANQVAAKFYSQPWLYW